jgi:hypothetical protein
VKYRIFDEMGLIDKMMFLHEYIATDAFSLRIEKFKYVLGMRDKGRKEFQVPPRVFTFVFRIIVNTCSMTVLQEEVISLGSGGLTGGLVDPEFGRGLWGRRGVTAEAASHQRLLDEADPAAGTCRLVIG